MRGKSRRKNVFFFFSVCPKNLFFLSRQRHKKKLTRFLPPLPETIPLKKKKKKKKKRRQKSTKKNAKRACVASYFVHLVAEDLRAWWTVRPTTAAAAANAAMGAPRALAFPLVSVLVVLPSALAVVAGRFVPAAATLLAAEMLWKSTRLLYIQALLVFSHGRAPSELLAKKVAMCGVAALVAAHPVASGAGGEAEGTGRRGRRRRGGGGAGGGGGSGDFDASAPSSSSAAAAAPGKSNSFAGPLIDSAARRLEAAGLGRSALLLAGRLLVCALLLSGGLAQLRRVAKRGWRPWRRWAAPSSVAFEDGHDNNFLLLELALALPFALGWRVPEVTRALAGTLFAEAAVCWPVWRHWPNPCVFFVFLVFFAPKNTFFMFSLFLAFCSLSFLSLSLSLSLSPSLSLSLSLFPTLPFPPFEKKTTATSPRTSGRTSSATWASPPGCC